MVICAGQSRFSSAATRIYVLVKMRIQRSKMIIVCNGGTGLGVQQVGQVQKCCQEALCKFIYTGKGRFTSAATRITEFVKVRNYCF